MKREAYNHPKMLDLASRLGVSRTHACGIIDNLWNWAADFATLGDVGKWNNGVISKAVDWNGDPDHLVESITLAGWLDPCVVNRLVIHDLEEHAPEWLKTKVKRTGKSFVTATPPSQVPGANERLGDSERTPPGGASAPLFSPLLCSALETSGNLTSARTVGQSQVFECSDSFLTDEKLGDPDAVDRWIDHETGGSHCECAHTLPPERRHARPDSKCEDSPAFRANAKAACAKAVRTSGIRKREYLAKWLIFGRHWGHLRDSDDDFVKWLQREARKDKASPILAFLDPNVLKPPD